MGFFYGLYKPITFFKPYYSLSDTCFIELSPHGPKASQLNINNFEYKHLNKDENCSILSNKYMLYNYKLYYRLTY